MGGGEGKGREGYTGNGKIADQLIRVRRVEDIIHDVDAFVLAPNGRSRLFERELIQHPTALQRGGILDVVGIGIGSLGHGAHRKCGVDGEGGHIEHDHAYWK